MAWGEAKVWNQGDLKSTFYQEMLDAATQKPARDGEKRKIVKPHEMPWENSPHGLLKHMVNESMHTRADTVDIYMQVIPPGSRSGKHRHLAEECIYILEGKGYDLHWDCDVEITDKYEWKASPVAQKFEWEAGDVVYIPPNTVHQHFNADPSHPVRIISATNRIYKLCGLNDLEQVETAPEYQAQAQL